MKEIGIYIHIPFCKSKCIYCDFNSFDNKNELIEKYIKCLKKEIQDIGNRIRLKSNGDYANLPVAKTIYIGGGTPSYISENYISEILKTIEINFDIKQDCEITIEVNPGTVTLEKMKKYREIGINRISIGLQSANDRLLKILGRIHNYEQFLQTVNLAKLAGIDNISADIIIGLPNQTIYDVEDTVNKLIELNLNHISVYSLIVEPNTKLEEKVNNGVLELPDDETERYMYWYTKRKLEENGYIHYEISNFAKPPFRSKHNLSYWNQEEYIGLGLSASSYENNIRYKNIDDLEKYIENISNDNIAKNTIIEEKQSKEDKMKEYMILGLRKINGINITEFRRIFNVSPLYLFNKELTKLVREDLIRIDINNIRLSKKGLDLANIVWEEFI